MNFSTSCVALALALSPVQAAIQSVTAADAAGGLTASAWSGISAAYDVGRHVAHPVDGGYEAHNPGQQWETRFDGRGFTTKPDAGVWTWGLELVNYGFVGSEQVVTTPLQLSAEGGRVAYEWDEFLTEWYVNDTRGMEHGYTVHRRLAGHELAGEDGPLTFTLAVRGGLEPKVTNDARGVRFLDGDSQAVLRYTGLFVYDADGQDLPAQFELSRQGLLLSVDERGARYPLTIDPTAQQAYLKASNCQLGDQFGRAVAVSGDTVVVGARRESSDATGVGADQNNNNASTAGAAYVFVRNGETWTQQAYLKASNTSSGDFFGSSVSVSGDTVVIGAYHEDSSATGVDGDPFNDNSPASGAAYVFVRNGVTWSQQAYLKASNSGTEDRFGSAVAVDGDIVVVGAFQEDSNATGVNGAEGNESASSSGAAYVFGRSGVTWTQHAYLKASNTEALDGFGFSVAVSAGTVVVTANVESSNATGVNGDQNDNTALNSGAAYVFTHTLQNWSQQAYLKASNTSTNDGFETVAVSGDTVVIGAPREDSAADGVNGNQADNSALAAGAAYVFVRSGLTWTQQAYLKASNSHVSDLFGCAVAVSGDTVAIGAYEEDSGASGLNGDQNNDTIGDSGAAYVFVRDGATWSQRAYLKASNPGSRDSFGFSLALSDETLIVGAWREDSDTVLVNGDQGDNSASNSGAGYLFELQPAPPAATFCFGVSCPCGNDDSQGGCRNSSGVGGRLSAPASASISADSLVLSASQLPPGNLGLFFAADTFCAPVMVGDGMVCIGGSAWRFRPGPIAIDGSLTRERVISSAPISLFAPGEVRYFQVWFRDVFCSPLPVPCPSPCGSATNITNAVQVFIAP